MKLIANLTIVGSVIAQSYDYAGVMTPYPSSANNDVFNYVDPFAGLDDSRIGTLTGDDQKDTTFWSFMHSMWNHYQVIGQQISRA